MAAECVGYGGSKRSSGAGSFFFGLQDQSLAISDSWPAVAVRVLLPEIACAHCSHEIKGVDKVFLHVFPLQLFASIPCRLSSITKVFCDFVRLGGN